MIIRPIAIHLPQFHPIPENDEWWGKGFTEWTNVTKAKPLFKGHYQPHLPSDLGFYDLRLPESRQAQADLAKEYGIHGFCYYHYWFNGKRILEKPFQAIFESRRPDFPFCLFWANETWSRRWLGEQKEILLKQSYSPEDDYVHAAYLANVFSDERYITIEGRPVFIIYRVNDLPDPVRTIEIIKKASYERNKIEPYLVASNSHTQAQEKLIGYGFDAVLNFRPQLGALPYAFEDQFSFKRLIRNVRINNIFSGFLKIYGYKEALKLMQNMEPDNFDKIIPSVFVGWDNTARRGKKGIIIQDNHPAIFEEELKRIKSKILASKENPRLLFINAWNEWAEGNHLEPDQKNGRAYLDAIKNLVNNQ